MGLLGFGELACCTPGGRTRLGSDGRPYYSCMQLEAERLRRGIAGGFQPTYGLNFTKPRVNLRGIAEGEHGTKQTLDAMKDAVLGPEGAHNADVRMLAQQIVSHVPNKDYRGEAQAIYEFMVKHVRYTLDPRGLEWVQTPWWTLLVQAQGDPRGPLSFGTGGHVGNRLRRSCLCRLRTRRRPRARLRLPHRQGGRGASGRVEPRLRRDRHQGERAGSLASCRLNGEVRAARGGPGRSGQAPHEDLGRCPGVSRRGDRPC